MNTVEHSRSRLDARAAGLMALLCFLWGLQQISLKAVAGAASPMLMIAARSIGAGLLLAALMGWRGETPKRHRWRAGAVAGALFGLEYLLVAEALRLTLASHVTVFLYAAPVFAALGLHVKLPAERLGVVQWSGIVLAFIGLAIAFLGGGEGTLAGDALALLASVCWGATTVTIRCSSLARAPATETLLYQLIGAAVILAPAAVLMGEWHFDGSTRAWAHLGFQTLLVSFASFLAWFWLLRHYLASRLGVFTFLTPLFGVLLGAGLLGEPLRPDFLAGGALILVGIVLVSGHDLGSAAVRFQRGEGTLPDS